jgi:hypothetical protein
LEGLVLTRSDDLRRSFQVPQQAARSRWQEFGEEDDEASEMLDDSQTVSGVVPMDLPDVTNQLERIASSDDFASRSSELTGKWSEASDGFDAVEPILRFMESHPLFDFGAPGSLVHFAESFFGKGYEQRLVESVQRRPTIHTVWMLNRAIHGTNSPVEKRGLIEAMKEASTNPVSEPAARSKASHFLGRLQS